MDDPKIELIESDRPHFWNPNAAALWSLLFTPAFGAYLHALNWRTLRNPEQARANIVFVWLTLAFLTINAVMVFVPETKAIDQVMRVAGVCLLVGWYMSLGRSQVQHVKEIFGKHYVRKRWGIPLAISVAAIGAYFGLIFLVMTIAYKPDPAELAAEVKPMILEEWHKTPELQGATIQNITLTHRRGNVYTGFLDARLPGQSEIFELEVIYDGVTISWKLEPLKED